MGYRKQVDKEIREGMKEDKKTRLAYEKIAAIIWNHLCALGEGPGSISGAEAVDMQTGEILEK